MDIINGNDILRVVCEVNTGSEFNHVVIATLETNKGFIEVLFDREGELVPPGKQDTTVRQINNYFNKSFTHSILDNTACYLFRFRRL
jgi:hypothetical protein